MRQIPYEKSQEREEQLVNYRNRLRSSIDLDAKKHGFDLATVAQAYKMSQADKDLLESEWNAYYREVGKCWRRDGFRLVYRKSAVDALPPKPYQPAPSDYPEYIEFLRIDGIISSSNTNSTFKGLL